MTFDKPKTRAMAAFLASETRTDANPGGRVVGFSAEGPDGFFIYTESAEWCDDNGAGTFHGDSETKAIQAFRARVQRNPAKAAEAARLAFLRAHAAPLPEVLTPDTAEAAEIDGCDFPGALAMGTAESYATVYAPGGRPLATLSRPRMFGDKGPTRNLFTLALTDGRTMAAFSGVPTLGRVRNALRAYARAALAKPESFGSEVLAMPSAEYIRAEVRDYESSFSDNWRGMNEDSDPFYRSGNLTRAARWARRLNLAEVALAAVIAEDSAFAASMGAETGSAPAGTYRAEIATNGALFAWQTLGTVATYPEARALIEAARERRGQLAGERITLTSTGAEVANPELAPEDSAFAATMGAR